ncbi:MAG: PRC-barrel domain-containing protein [Caldilineaceae bacterium]|nr:PRC-barrel domain-containing protein [Caldilineaceae bacterium]
MGTSGPGNAEVPSRVDDTAVDDTAVGMDETEIATDTVETEAADQLTDTASVTDTTSPMTANPSMETMTDTIGTDTIGTDTIGTDTITDTTGTETAGDVTDATGSSQWMLGYSLIERSFTNADGEVSGNVNDLVVDLRSGYILLAEIEYGGFLDIGDREILVPLRAFRESTAGEELLLGFDEQMLENYPDLGDNSPRLDDPAWYDAIGAFWNNVIGDETPQANGMDLSRVDVTSDPIVRANDLLGFSLVDLGSGVGTIQNMLINLGQSRARYLMVSYGTGAADTDPFLIPFSAIDIVDIDANEITLDANVSMETLQLAPRFDRFLFGDDGLDNGSMMIDDGYISEVDAFWQEQGITVEDTEAS